MKLSAQDRATLARIAAPGYTFSLQPPWPYGFEPQPYTPRFKPPPPVSGWGRSKVSADYLQKIKG